MIPLLFKLGLYGCLDNMPDVLPPEEGEEGSSLPDNDHGGISVADDTEPSPSEIHVNTPPVVTNLKIPPNVTGVDSCFESGNSFQPTFRVEDPDNDPVGCSVELYSAAKPSEPLETLEIPVGGNGQKTASFNAASMSPFKPGNEQRDFYIQVTCSDDQKDTGSARSKNFQTPLADECMDPDGDGFVTIRDNCPDVSNGQQLDSDDDGLGNACDHRPVIRNRSPIGGARILPDPASPNMSAGWTRNNHIPFYFEVYDPDKDVESCTITRTNQSTNETVSDVIPQEHLENSFPVGRGYPADQFQPITDYCWNVSCEDRAGNVSLEGAASCFTTLDFGLVLWLRFKDHDNLGHDSSGFGNHAEINGNITWTDGNRILGPASGKLNNGGVTIPFGGTNDAGDKIPGGGIHVPNFRRLNPDQNFTALIRFLTFDDYLGVGLITGVGGSWHATIQRAHIPGRVGCAIERGANDPTAITRNLIENRILYNSLCSYDGRQIRSQLADRLNETEPNTFNETGPLTYSGNSMAIGTTPGNLSLIGIVDEVLFYDRAITQEWGSRLFCNLDHGVGHTCQ